jgi:hypothetical protein
MECVVPTQFGADAIQHHQPCQQPCQVLLRCHVAFVGWICGLGSGDHQGYVRRLMKTPVPAKSFVERLAFVTRKCQWRLDTSASHCLVSANSYFPALHTDFNGHNVSDTTLPPLPVEYTSIPVLPGGG